MTTRIESSYLRGGRGGGGGDCLHLCNEVKLQSLTQRKLVADDKSQYGNKHNLFRWPRIRNKCVGLRVQFPCSGAQTVPCSRLRQRQHRSPA